MLFMTNGYSQDIYGSKLTLAGDHTLTDQEKCLVVSINMTAASKTVILGVADGDAMTVINIGSNTFTVKNIAGDTGTSLEANGMVTVIGGGDTADAAKFITGGGGGGGGGSTAATYYIPIQIENWSISFAQNAQVGYFDFVGTDDMSEILDMASDYCVILANYSSNSSGYAVVDSFGDDGEGHFTGRVFITLATPAPVATTVTQNDFELGLAALVFTE